MRPRAQNCLEGRLVTTAWMAGTSPAMTKEEERVRQSVGKTWWHSRSADAARGADGSRRRCGDARGAPRAAGGRRLARRGQEFYRKGPRAGDRRHRGQVGDPRPDGGEDRP